MKKYDYLVVGSGLYGAVFAREAKKAGKSVLVIDKRPNIAGNVYTEDVEKIHVHKYPPVSVYGTGLSKTIAAFLDVWLTHFPTLNSVRITSSD